MSIQSDSLRIFIPKFANTLTEGFKALGSLRDMCGSTATDTNGTWDSREYEAAITAVDANGVPLIPDSVFEEFGITREALLGAIAVTKGLISSVDASPAMKASVDLMRRDQ